MKALTANRDAELEITQGPDPTVGPDQVLVRTLVSAVSVGTELRMLYRNDGSTPGHPGWPAVGAFGYLASGVVEEVGPEVSGILPGQHVACGTPWGAHRDLLVTAPSAITPLPDGIDALVGACSYWAVPPLCGILAASPSLDETVAVIGLGPLGLTAVQWLHGRCARVIAVDPIERRREVATSYGAACIDPRGGDVVTQLERRFDARPQVVLQVAGSQGALELALQMVAPLGRIVNIGTLPRLRGFDLFWPLQESGASLLPIHRPGTSDPQAGGVDGPRRLLPEVFDAVLKGRMDIRGLCTHVFDAVQAPDVFPALRDQPERFLGVAFDWRPTADGVASGRRR